MTDGPQRDYQANFSELYPHAAADQASRLRKAATIAAVLTDHLGAQSLRDARVLDVGASTGVIDRFLAGVCGQVTGIDIDQAAIAQALRGESRPNLAFRVGDALALDQGDGTVDVVICAHVYEHVPDPHRLMQEIGRVLRPGGVCYFAAGNRFQPMEPHHRLPLLSVVPVPVAHLYLRALRRGDRYYERHLSYWELKDLVRDFVRHDYTRRLIEEPQRFATDYMLRPGSWKQRVARWMVRGAYPLLPTYIWLLEKPGTVNPDRAPASPPRGTAAS